MNPPKYLPEGSPDDPMYDSDFSEDLWKNLDVLLAAYLGQFQNR